MFVMAALYAGVAARRWLEVSFVRSGNTVASATAARRVARVGCSEPFEGSAWPSSVRQVGVTGHRGGSAV